MQQPEAYDSENVMTVATRFAPSPTGHLHIGGVRTAIFNWAFARRHGGRFVLRIDDTDVERHREEALQPILDGLKWLGLLWDEGPEVGGPYGPYFQSQRLDIYRRYAERLVAAGHAYPCFCTPEELEAEREQARAERRPYRYSGKCRNLDPEERRGRIDRGMPYVLRVPVPPGRTIVVDDAVLGRVEQQSDEIGDFVIVRANGIPLYNFATVVDDIEMRITHVIRAQEHLSNTFRQILLFEALGQTPPVFAHVPYVAAPGSKEKLSKRHLEKYKSRENLERFRLLGYSPDEIPSPVLLEYYIALGYLPDAVLNGLARIGWSLDDRTEKIPRDVLIANFSLDRIHRSPASFDPDKLYWLQGEYMRELPVDQKVDGAIPFLKRAGLAPEQITHEFRQLVKRVVEALGDRMKLFSDILVYGRFFFTDEISYDDAALKNLRKQGAVEALRHLRERLAQVEPFDAAHIETAVRSLAEELGVGAGKLIHPLRAAVSGQTVGPGVFELLEIVGKERTLRRIDDALKLVG